MNSNEFRLYLRRKGKKEHVVDGLLTLTKRAQSLLKKDLEKFSLPDLKQVLQIFESRHPGDGRKAARALALYFAMTGREELKAFASGFRESAIAKTRSAFALKDFQGVNPAHIENLRAAKIFNTGQLLACTRTKAEREAVAQKIKIPYAAILELVKLSDLSRIPGVKQVRARLYHDAGIDTVEKMAKLDPDILVMRIREFVAQTGFPGVPTLPQEAWSTVKAARELTKQIEYLEDEW